MAFISKVVFMLLLSTLAWVQVSSDQSQGTAALLIKSLKGIDSIATDIGDSVSAMSEENSVVKGPIISEKIEKLNAAISQSVADILSASSSSPTPSDEEGELAAQAVANTVAKQKGFLDNLTSKSGYIGLQAFFKDIDKNLVDYKHALGSTSSVTKKFPSSAKKAISNQVTSLVNTSLDTAIITFSKPLDP